MKADEAVASSNDEGDQLQQTSPEQIEPKSDEPEEDTIDIIAKDDELLKKILSRTISPQPNLHSPITPDLAEAYFSKFVIDDSDIKESTYDEYKAVDTNPFIPPGAVDQEVHDLMACLLDSVERDTAESIVDSDSDIEVLT